VYVSSALKMKATRFSETSGFQDAHCATFQKAAFIIVTAVKTSNPARKILSGKPVYMNKISHAFE
jgi:hypothetical protein